MPNNRETPRRGQRASSGSDATENVDSWEHGGSDPRRSGRVTTTSERIIAKTSVKRREAMRELANR